VHCGVQGSLPQTFEVVAIKSIKLTKITAYLFERFSVTTYNFSEKVNFKTSRGVVHPVYDLYLAWDI